jgi:hypothetical protein
MKTLIKLLIAAIIVNAVVRSALAATRYYRLKDSMEQVLVFGNDLRIAQLHDQIMKRAAELEVPLAPANMTVKRDGARTTVKASYTESIALFPNYLYPVDFTMDVQTNALYPSNADATPAR